MEEIEGKIIYYACGSLLRMDTEAAGAAYMEAKKKQAKGQCRSIICRDNGSFIHSSGVVSDSSDHTAPRTLAALGGNFGSMLKPQRPEYRRLCAAIQGLNSVVGLQSNAQEAQVSNKHGLLPHRPSVNAVHDQLCSDIKGQLCSLSKAETSEQILRKHAQNALASKQKLMGKFTVEFLVACACLYTEKSVLC